MHINKIITDKPTSKMTMMELFYNACYAEGGDARYRDYSRNVDTRDFIRELLAKYTDINLQAKALLNNETFDEWLLSCSIAPTDGIVGLIAVLYRTMIAAADLREYLKYYENNSHKAKRSGEE